MRKEIGMPGALVGMIVLSCLFGGLALAIYPGWPAIGTWFEKSDAPAWVQAVGSILAIFAAGSIAAWQASSSRRDAEKVRKETETARALAIDFILRRAKLVVSNAERAVISASSSTMKLACEQVEMVQQALRALPVFEIPSPRLVFDLQRLDRDLLYVLRVLGDAGKPDGRRRSGKAIFDRVQRRIDEARYAAVIICDKDAMRTVNLTGMGSLIDDEESTV